jgi:IS4 transposase
MVFTTLPATLLGASGVLELYRYRWQIELAFKRLKQLLKLGRLPHKTLDIARTWILAKLVVALLLETLYRNARVFSPWGYRLEALASGWS